MIENKSWVPRTPPPPVISVKHICNANVINYRIPRFATTLSIFCYLQLPLKLLCFYHNNTLCFSQKVVSKNELLKRVGGPTNNLPHFF